MKASEFISASMTEDQLGENIRDACSKLGWRFLWLRKAFLSSAGILDLMLIPQRETNSRHILHRELKGFDANGRLGQLTVAQAIIIEEINAAGGDADEWTPQDWPTRILEELQ